MRKRTEDQRKPIKQVGKAQIARHGTLPSKKSGKVADNGGPERANVTNVVIRGASWRGKREISSRQAQRRKLRKKGEH